MTDRQDLVNKIFNYAQRYMLEHRTDGVAYAKFLEQEVYPLRAWIIKKLEGADEVELLSQIAFLYRRATICVHDVPSKLYCKTCRMSICGECATIYHTTNGISCDTIRKSHINWIYHCLEMGHTDHCPHTINIKNMAVFDQIASWIQ